MSEEARREARRLQAQLLQQLLLAEEAPQPVRPDASGNTVIREVGGGRVVQGTDGQLSFVSPQYSTNNPAIVRRIMEGVSPAEASQMAEPVTTGGRVGIAARSALQGLTFGGGDEIVAAGQAAISDTPYAVALDRERERLREGREEAPVTAFGGEIAGAMIPAALTGYGLLNSNAGLGARSATGAGIGAGEGALYGFLSGEGGAQERAQNALTGGAIGAAAGGLLPSVFAAGRGAVERVAQPIGGLLNIGNESRAVNSMLRAFNESGLSVDDVTARLQQATNDGQSEYVLADALGESGRRALSGVARQPGPGRTAVKEFLDGRQTNQTDRLARFVQDALGAQDTAAQRTATLTAARDSTADTLYSAARQGAQPVDVRGALDVIDERVAPMRQGGVALDGVDSTLERYRNRLAASSPETTSIPGIGDNNPPISVELSDFDRVLNVKQDVGDDIGAAIRAGRGNEARLLGKLSRELDAALEDASDSYRVANDTYARMSRVVDAVDAGQQANRPGVRYEDTIQRFRAMSPEEQEAFRAGYANSILAKIENAPPTTNQARPLLSDRQQAILGAISDDPQALLRRIARENEMFETRATAVGGSQTANNMADQAGVNAEDIGVIGNLLGGRPVSALGQVAGNFVSAATGNNEGTREALGQMMMSRNPGGLLQAIGQAQRTEARDRLVGGALRGAARTGGLLAYSGG